MPPARRANDCRLSCRLGPKSCSPERQARSEELNKQLRHERAMRVRDEYRTALDDAAVIGVRFRERLARR